MASAKRKDGGISTKTQDDRSQKRRRLDASGKKKRPPLSERNEKTPTAAHASSKLATISQLANEQPAFPRGGADILTPLEKKQIRAQAERDVLIEQKQKKINHLFDSPEDDAISLEGQGDDLSEIGGQVKKSKSNKSSKRLKVQKVNAESTPRIEGLNYKRITSGSLILGRIAKVNPRDLAVSLPNNLTGYVPLTAVSAQLNKKIESLVGKGLRDGLGNDDSHEEEDDVDLRHYFHSGQWVRVSVTSTEADATQATGKAKKRIGLSLDPKLTNGGLKSKDLAVNCTLQGSVISIEDHGLIVDVGLPDGNARGFIPSQELHDGLEHSQVKPGMVLLCLVKSLGGGGRIVKLSAKIENLDTSKALSLAPSVSTFLPGTLV
jgi:rRNA biogenesis protein RRP5